MLEELLFMAYKAGARVIKTTKIGRKLWEKKIRELIYVYHKQEGYLQIAKERNFEATDKFRSMDSGNEVSGKN